MTSRLSRWQRAIVRWTNAVRSRRCCVPERTRDQTDFTRRRRLHGDQAKRYASLGQRAGRALHRERPRRCAVPGERARARRGPVDEIGPGDVVIVGPNEKHWHGASPTTAMTHIAIQESLDGKAVEWLEKVTDEQYQGKP